MLSLGELNEYKLLFKTSNLYQEMMKSGLDSAVLKSVWDQSTQHGGKTLLEFIVALELCKYIVKNTRFPMNIEEFKSILDQDMRILERLEDTSRDWAISPQEKLKYDEIFKSNDPQKSGFITGDVARNIFAQSGLRENMLAHIWSLSDVEKRGKLNSDEFAVAMHLTYSKLNGIDLPAKLPSNLVPPSHRSLQALSDMAKLSVASLASPKSTPHGSPSGSLLSLTDQLGIKPNLAVSGSTSKLAGEQEQTAEDTQNIRIELGIIYY